MDMQIGIWEEGGRGIRYINSPSQYVSNTVPGKVKDSIRVCRVVYYVMNGYIYC